MADQSSWTGFETQSRWLDEPKIRASVALLADGPEALARARQWALLAGLEAIDRSPSADPDPAPATGEAILEDLVLVAIDQPGPGADPLLLMAANSLRPVVASFPVSAIDLVAALLVDGTTALLCDAQTPEAVAALAVMGVEALQGVKDATADSDTTRLSALAGEVARIGRLLAQIAGDEHSGSGFADGMIGYRVQPGASVAGQGPITAADIRGLIRLRRLRDRYFDPKLFADPVWDMLLDLLAARLEHTPVAVSSLCIAAAVPATTALRAIRQMTDAGLFVRVADPLDRRRIFIELSPACADAMMAYCRASLACRIPGAL